MAVTAGLVTRRQGDVTEENLEIQYESLALT